MSFSGNTGERPDEVILVLYLHRELGGGRGGGVVSFSVNTGERPVPVSSLYVPLM